jgi:antibiotic biosynthesis monooxygenase (ABM) superfamily enzyme
MTMPENKNRGDAGDNGPVTVIVTRKAKKERTKEFEEWMDGIVHEAMKFEGHMGVNIIRPSDPSANPEYVIIFRFNSYDNLAKWENSEIRNQWLKKSRGLTEGKPLVEKQTGLEFWFTPRSGKDSGTTAPPPRYKMAIVTGGIIFILLNTLLPLIRQLTIDLPLLLSTLVAIVIMVPLMTYVVMPSVTRLLRPWLSRKGLF